MKRGKRRYRALLKWSLGVMAGLALVSVALVGTFRWLDPPISAVMIQHWVAARLDGEGPPYIQYEWVDWDAIAKEVPLAVLAAEDQRFPRHKGFDLVEIRNAVDDFQDGGRLRGASTISQQTAKNLFLWGGRDFVRKGLEVWLTVLIEAMWPKQRILEVYLNIAQFGPQTFGVGAASWRYFSRPVGAIGRDEATLLAAVLPNPNVYRLDRPSDAVRRRGQRIARQMRQLGGVGYLKRLTDGDR